MWAESKSCVYKFKCGLDEEKFNKLMKLTKMVKSVKCEYRDEEGTMQFNGTIKTNRKWEILKETMENGQ